VEALRVARDEPDHLARNHALRGAILHDQGEHSAAARAFDAAAVLEPRPSLRRSLWLAERLCDLGDFDAALALTEPNRAHCRRLGWGAGTSRTARR
jgi:hypothetical protein